MTCKVCGKQMNPIDTHLIQCGVMCLNRNCLDYGKYYIMGKYAAPNQEQANGRMIRK